MNTTCTRRIRSDTPLQSLTLANDPAFIEIARALAARMEKETAPSGDAAKVLDARLRLGFRLCLSREPSAKELALLRNFTLSQPPADALFCAARTLINLDNFITRE
jgi:hypothetical protein